MTNHLALALSGSNLTGEFPFSCCLRSGAELHTANPERGTRGDLALLARNLLSAHGASPSDVTELRVDVGPGSYTGLRVALTFTRFLQHFGDAKVLACDSLTLLASAAGDRTGRLHPLLDARRGRYHTATLEAVDGALRLVEVPAAPPCDEVLGRIQRGDSFVVAHAIGEDHKRSLRERGAELIEVTGISAERLFDERLAMTPHEASDLEPRYLMASYAE